MAYMCFPVIWTKVLINHEIQELVTFYIPLVRHKVNVFN